MGTLSKEQNKEIRIVRGCFLEISEEKQLDKDSAVYIAKNNGKNKSGKIFNEYLSKKNTFF